LAASLATLATLAIQWSGVHTGAPRKKEPLVLYKVGDRVKDTAELALASAPRTLVLITASTCHFCTESMEFYKTLVGTARSTEVQVLGATFEDVEVNRKYLSGRGIAIQRVISADSNSLHRTGTPALLLLSKSGAVEKWWLGKLQPAQEAEVIAAIGGAAH
jgi:hypothetical protein